MAESSAGGGSRAEFAVRWDPADGGPRTAEQAIAALNLKPRDKDNYEVRYFVTGQVLHAPVGFETTLRERRKGKRTELTLKYRGNAPLSALPRLEQWQCPLGEPSEKKEEVDISFTATASVGKVYSRSCSVELTGDSASYAAALGAKPMPCMSSMLRLRAGELKVEQWRLPGGATVLEVSRSGHDSVSDLQDFRDRIVSPLTMTGAKPSERSKTAGSRCE